MTQVASIKSRAMPKCDKHHGKHTWKVKRPCWRKPWGAQKKEQDKFNRLWPRECNLNVFSKWVGLLAVIWCGSLILSFLSPSMWEDFPAEGTPTVAAGFGCSFNVLAVHLSPRADVPALVMRFCVQLLKRGARGPSSTNTEKTQTIMDWVGLRLTSQSQDMLQKTYF